MNTTIKSLAVCFTLITSAITVGCGLQDGGTDGTGGTPPPDCQGTCGSAGDGGSGGQADAGTGGTGGDAGTTVTPPATGNEPAPAEAPKACMLTFARKYANGSPCGEVRGTLPGMTWTSGQFVGDADNDGRFELTYDTIAAGSYSLSYLDVACKNEVPRNNWAAYGDPGLMRSMTADARAFLYCNWYDAGTGKTLTVSDPGCNIRIKVADGCVITPDGNMRDFK